MDVREIVWVKEYRTFANLESMGAYASFVRFTTDKGEYAIYVDNDDLDFGFMEEDDI